jgi:hypothetical protein
MKAAVVHSFDQLGGADQAISTAVSPSAFEQAFGSLARGGTLVCVGLPAHNEMQLPIFQTVLGGLTVKGSIVGTHHDLEEVFELHRRGRTHVERVERELEDVNDAIEQVLDGSAPAPRMVFRMTDVPASSGEHASTVAAVAAVERRGTPPARTRPDRRAAARGDGPVVRRRDRSRRLRQRSRQRSDRGRAASRNVRDRDRPRAALAAAPRARHGHRPAARQLAGAGRLCAAWR